MFQNGFFVRLVKTTKIDVNDQVASLPPDAGTFDEFKVSEYYCPDEWSKDGVFVKAEEGEPLWIDLTRNPVCACIPSIQRLNPVTGEPADLEGGLKKDPKQNYLRLPEQKWLDGYANDGKVYQFTITKAGAGLAVSEYVLPKHMQDSHALGFAFFSPKNPPQPVSRPVVYPHFGNPYQFDKFYWSSHPVGDAIFEASLLDGEEPCYGSLTPSLTPKHPKSGTLRCASMPVQMDTAALDKTGIRLPQSTQADSRELMAGADDNECAELMAGIDYDDDVMSVIEEGVVADTMDITEQLKIFDKASMGAGGRIHQEISHDENTVDYYHEKPDGVLTVYLALPEQFDAIMKKGRRQDSSKQDKYVYSGKISGIQVPLIH